jgi:hypothetical protein
MYIFHNVDEKRVSNNVKNIKGCVCVAFLAIIWNYLTNSYVEEIIRTRG